MNLKLLLLDLIKMNTVFRYLFDSERSDNFIELILQWYFFMIQFLKYFNSF